jgi:hypothetical protein
MPMSSWQGLLISMQTAGTAVTGTTEGSLLATQAKYTLPANAMVYAGQTLRIRAAGQISNVATTPGTLTFRVKFGSIVVATSQALTLNTTLKTNVTWILDWDLTCRSVGGGTAATFIHTGQWQSESVAGSSAAGATGTAGHIIPQSAPAVGTGFDSTVTNVIDLAAIFSVTGNSIQATSYKLESLN